MKIEIIYEKEILNPDNNGVDNSYNANNTYVNYVPQNNPYPQIFTYVQTFIFDGNN